MVSKEDLKAKFQNLSNYELFDIVDNKFEYTELAVLVALEEIAARNISEIDIEKYKAEKVKEAKSYVEKNIVDDLSFLQKNFYFYVWIPFLSSAFRRNLFLDGYLLKHKQAIYYSWFGFIFFIALTILLQNLNVSIWTFFICWMLSFGIAFFFDEFFNRKAQYEKLKAIFSKQQSKDSDQT